jgi:hypothetical protein
MKPMMTVVMRPATSAIPRPPAGAVSTFANVTARATKTMNATALGIRLISGGYDAAAAPYRLRSARTNSTVPTIVNTRKKPIVIARSTIGGWSTAAEYSGLPQ